MARAFIDSRTDAEGLHSLSKVKMTEIRDAVLRGEGADDECWLKSLKNYFDGMSAGCWVVLIGCLATGVLIITEIGRSLGFVSTKKGEEKKPPTLVVDLEKLHSSVATRV